MGELLNERLKKYNRFAFELTNWNQAPDCAGVYFIVDELDDQCLIQYIGSSKCLIDRIRNHEIIRSIKKKGHFYFTKIYIVPMNLKDYRPAEAFFIQEFKPSLNKNKPDYHSCLRREHENV